MNYETRGMNHTEGGWPKDINPTDLEQTVRFKKKIEKDDTYIHSVRQLSHVGILFLKIFYPRRNTAHGTGSVLTCFHLLQTMEHNILQNNALNLYELYFDDNESVATVNQKYYYKTLNVFTDPAKHKRPVQQISWSSDGGTHLAASYCNLAFQEIKNENTNSYIWDIGTTGSGP